MLAELINKNKAMTTLGKVYDRVDDMSKDCVDEIVPVDEISFDDFNSVNIGGCSHPLRPLAQQSIAYKLGIPIQYLRKCQADVQAYNLNHWVKQEKSNELLFRFDGDYVRAVFSTRYIPMDNFEVMEKLDSMGYSEDSPVQCHLDPEFMLLNIPDGNKSFSLKKDNMVPGISISNSEVGLASLGISAYIMRLVCTNGLIVNETVRSTKYKHISRKILDEFADVVGNISSDVSNQKRQLTISSKSEVGSPMDTFESFNRQFQLNQMEKDAVEWGWPLEEGKKMFNVIQTYTRAAQFEGLSAESSFKLQKVGGSILAMMN